MHRIIGSKQLLGVPLVHNCHVFVKISGRGMYGPLQASRLANNLVVHPASFWNSTAITIPSP